MLPLKIQRLLPDRQEPSLAPKLLPVSHVNFIFNFVPHVIYSLWICTFAITKFINKILRNQIQYWYISKQVVMLSDIDGDYQLKDKVKLACLDLVSDTQTYIYSNLTS